MDVPSIHLAQIERGTEAAGCLIGWSVVCLSDSPVVIRWAEIDHDGFRAERQDFARLVSFPDAPARLRLLVPRGEPETSVHDALLQMGVVWQGEEWSVVVPLLVEFDRKGLPNTSPGISRARRMSTGNEHDAVRDRILKVIYDQRAGKPAGYLERDEIISHAACDADDTVYHLDVLERDGYVEVERMGGGNFLARLTALGQQRVREGYRVSASAAPVTIGPIGAIVHTMTGGALQAVGSASQSELSQVVNDPTALRAQLDELLARLVEAVKNDLAATDLMAYVRATEHLREEMLAPKPDQGRIRTLLGALSFMGNVEGTLGLMERVWPQVTALLALAGVLFPRS